MIEATKSSPSTFTEEMEVTLKVTSLSATINLVAGDLESWVVDLHLWGFDATVSFVVEDDSIAKGPFTDTLKTSILKHELLTVELGFRSRYARLSNKLAPEIITLKGYAEEKSFEELESRNVSGQPCIQRRYTLYFSDPLQVAWRQHYPNELFRQKSFADVIKTHTPTGTTVTCTHKPALEKIPFIFIGLGLLVPQASFYDLMMWYADHNLGHWTFDVVANTYKLVDDRTVGESKAEHLHQDHVEKFHTTFGKPRRFLLRSMNASVTAGPHVEEPVTDKIDRIRKDVLFRTDVAHDFQALATTQQSRNLQPTPELVFNLKSWPAIPLRPGCLVSLKGGLWHQKLITYPEDYRIVRLKIEADKLSPGSSDERHAEWAPFRQRVALTTEPGKEKPQRIPAYVPPQYPVEAEGLAISNQGMAPNLTWEQFKDKDSQLPIYHIKMPVFKEELDVPFDPHFSPGHFFFPAYRNERVLVALEFKRAWIIRFLDWKPGAQLRMPTQGNHLLMGWTEQSRTSFKHVYEAQKPVFSIERRNARDTEVMRVFEGTMILRVEEEKIAPATGVPGSVPSSPGSTAAGAAASGGTGGMGSTGGAGGGQS